VVSPWYEKYVRQVSGGGYVILGETFLSGNFDLFLARTDMILIKTDGNGNLQWAKTHGGTLDDSARVIVQTSDGGYITGTYDIFLIKTDSSGKNIVVAGYTRSFGAGLHDFLLLKTDSLGNLQ